MMTPDLGGIWFEVTDIFDGPEGELERDLFDEEPDEEDETEDD